MSLRGTAEGLTLRTALKICKKSRKPDPPQGVGHSSADGTGERLLLVGGEVVLRRATHLDRHDVVKLFVSGPETKVRDLNTLQYTLTPNWPKPRP